MTTQLQLKPQTAFMCPSCNAMAYFERHDQWPTAAAAHIHLLHRSTDEKKFHIGIWGCISCKQIVVLAYPNGLGLPAEKIWPLGNTRNLTEKTLSAGTIPEHVINDFYEAAKIEEICPMASATISRRCLQSILNDKFRGQITGFTKLKKQVQAVIDSKLLPPYIADELHGIRSIGNSAAHTNIDPATNEIIDIEIGEASACLDVIEDLVTFLYIDPYRARARKAARESKFGPDNK